MKILKDFTAKILLGSTKSPDRVDNFRCLRNMGKKKKSHWNAETHLFCYVCNLKLTVTHNFNASDLWNNFQWAGRSVWFPKKIWILPPL